MIETSAYIDSYRKTQFPYLYRCFLLYDCAAFRSVYTIIGSQVCEIRVAKLFSTLVQFNATSIAYSYWKQIILHENVDTVLHGSVVFSFIFNFFRMTRFHE